jgi:ABC-type branched-subunit amino acid transport system ATPase component
MTAILQVHDVSKRFGGVEAVKGVSFDVERGALVGLIGPNGAGKTTMVNIISAHQTSTSGQILLDGKPIQKYQTFEVAREGVSRTYQQNRLFLEDTVSENIRIGLVWSGRAHRPDLTYPGAQGSENQRLEALLALFCLKAYSDIMPNELGHLVRRRVEIAQALALAPKLLLLDEPFAGFSREEADELIAILRECQRGGLTILLIEHNMEVVMNICEYLYVMHHGALLASGKPADIQANEQVVSVYLGASL